MKHRSRRAMPYIRALAYPRVPSSQADSVPLLHIYSFFDMNHTLFSRYVSKKGAKTNVAQCYALLVFRIDMNSKIVGHDDCVLMLKFDNSAEVHSTATELSDHKYYRLMCHLRHLLNFFFSIQSFQKLLGGCESRYILSLKLNYLLHK